MSREDEELIAGYLQGEPAAMQVIEGWIRQAAASFQRRLAAEWDDVLQTIRLEITRVLCQGAFRGEARLRTYLWYVINHTCVDQVRAPRPRPLVDLDELIQRAGPSKDSPLGKVLRDESEHRRWRILQAMPAPCRALWAMIREGLSYRQVSQRLGVSEVAVRQQARRCRQRAVAAWKQDRRRRD